MCIRDRVTSFDQVKTMDKAAAIEAGLYNVISDEVEEGYFGELRKLCLLYTSRCV